MNEIAKLLEKGFKTGMSNTPEFLRFVFLFKKAFNKELATIGATLHTVRTGHFYLYGLITLENKKSVYFTTPDVRQWQKGDSHFGKLLFRQVFKEEKPLFDTTGTNCRVEITDGMAKIIKNRIEYENEKYDPQWESFVSQF